MNQHVPELVLASSSIYRARLLQRLGIPFVQVTPNVDESSYPDETAFQLALRLAQQKAEACTAPGALVIGSDQVAVLAGERLNKPGTVDAACKQLMAMSGASVEFFTGVAVVDSETLKSVTTVVPTTVTMRRYSDAEVIRYVSRDEPLDCAGSFKWEALGIAMMESIDSTDPTALEGLPLIVLSDALRQFGLLVP